MPDKDKQKSNDKKTKQPEYSEADQQLIEKIQFRVTRITSPDTKSPLEDLNTLSKMVLTSKKTRTSIPKELKFMKTHYTTLTTHFDTLSPSPFTN